MPPGQAGQRHIKPSHPPSTCDATGEAPPQDSATALGCLLLVNQLSGCQSAELGRAGHGLGADPCAPVSQDISGTACQTAPWKTPVPVPPGPSCRLRSSLCTNEGPAPSSTPSSLDHDHTSGLSTALPTPLLSPPSLGLVRLPLFRVLTLGTIMSRSSLLCLGSAREDVWDHNGHELGKAEDWLGRMVVTLPPAAGCLRLVPWESGKKLGGSMCTNDDTLWGEQADPKPLTGAQGRYPGPTTPILGEAEG